MNSNNTNVVEDSTEFVIEPTQVVGNGIQRPRMVKRKVPVIRNKKSITDIWNDLEHYTKLSHANPNNTKQNAITAAVEKDGFIIAYDYEYVNDKKQLVKTKRYKIAENYQQYVEFLRCGDHHMYEVFTDFRNIKFYIDLDAKNIPHIEGVPCEERMAELEESCNQVVNYFQKCLQELDPESNVTALVQDSSGLIDNNYKFSRHVVFNGIVFENVQSVEGYLYEFLLASDDNIKELYNNDFIDSMPYKHGSDPQQFRAVGQTKINDPRILQICGSSFEDNLVIINPEIVENAYAFDCDVDFKEYIRNAKNQLKRSVKKRVAEDDERSVRSTESKRKKTSKESTDVEFEKGEIHEFNQEQHDLVLEMLRNIPSSMYKSNEEFYALTCMLRACDFTYEEFYDSVFGPYLDYIRMSENRESSRSTRYTEEKYLDLTCDFATYSLIVSYCKKHYNAIISNEFERKFSKANNWYYHMKRKFEEHNFCISSTEYIITREPLTGERCFLYINHGGVFREKFQSWYIISPIFGKCYFADWYQHDSKRRIVHNVIWQPLRNGEVGGKIYETIEEDEEGNPIVRYNYNTWSGFLYERRTPLDTPRNRLFLEIWLKICDNMCSHPDNKYFNIFRKFLHSKIAAIIQYPDDLTKVGCYFGSILKGEGKDYIIEQMIRILLANEFESNEGNRKRRSYGQTFEGANLHKSESGLFGTFNSLRDRRLLIHVNEYKPGVASIEDFRSAITAVDLIKNEKCKNGVSQKNYASFWVTGQDPNFECIDSDDRRWCLFEISGVLDKHEIIACDFDQTLDRRNIWSIAQNEMANDIDFHTYLFHYYRNLEVAPNTDWKNMIPKTVFRQNQVQAFDPKIQFLNHINSEIYNILQFENRETNKYDSRNNNNRNEEKYKIPCGEQTVRYIIEKTPFAHEIFIPCPDMNHLIKHYFNDNEFTLPRGKSLVNTVIGGAILAITSTHTERALKISATFDSNARIQKRFGNDKPNCFVFNIENLKVALSAYNEASLQKWQESKQCGL